MDLAALTTIWATLRDKLSQESGLDDDELMDTLDGELDLADRLRSLTRKRRELYANIEALKGLIKEMCERKLRLEKAAEAIGDAVTNAMVAANIKKLSAPDLSVSLSYKQPKLVGAEHLDTATIPDRFVRVKREIDRVALREALENGEYLEGCYLGNREPMITVRTQ